RAGIPGHEAAGSQLDLVSQGAFRKSLVAHEVDFADGGDITLEDIEADAYAIAWQRRDDGIDLYPIFAPRQILLLELEDGLLEHGLIEHAARPEAYADQGFVQGLGIEFAHAIEIDRSD